MADPVAEGDESLDEDMAAFFGRYVRVLGGGLLAAMVTVCV